METILKKKLIIFAVFFLVSLILTLPVLIGSGIVFKYDWAWPFFNLTQFWHGLLGSGSSGLFSSLSKNGPAIFGLFGLIHFPSTIFLKLFIFLVHLIAGYGFYRFIRNRVKSEVIAIVSGLAYAFTPYIFIRTIIGFVWSLVAYAVLPIFLGKFFQTKKNVLGLLIVGFLFSFIFGQIQAGLLVSLIITVYLVISLCRSDRLNSVKNYLFTYLSLLLFALPWLIAALFSRQSLAVVSGGSVTTLNFIASLPHSFRNMFMLSDHHITFGVFYPLAHNKLFLLGWLIVWAIALCSLFNKKNRELTLALIISSLLVLPFVKGPTGIFGNFYVWFYGHFPQIAIFRETYHFEFLYAIALCILFAFGLDWIWEKIDSSNCGTNGKKLRTTINIWLKILSAGSAVVIIAPYLTFNYAGYLKLQKLPVEYYQLNDYFQQNKEVCKKIYYPPGLGFIYFKGDNSPAASNSDTIAGSLGIPYLTDGASVLNSPSDEMFYRNQLVSQFYEKEDNGQFSALLNEGSIDCVILRNDLDTKYSQASNLGKETDPSILAKWDNNDLSALLKSKKGLIKTKDFGETISIYKIDPAYPVPMLNLNDKIEPFPKSGNNVSALPITDWAVDFAYYKDGWSRGRYDFWRKLLFTELRQDFLYTNMANATLTAKVSQRGNYEVWVRFLDGGQSGSFKMSLDRLSVTLPKSVGEERFIWKNIGQVNLDGSADFKLQNIAGENAISDIVLVSAN